MASRQVHLGVRVVSDARAHHAIRAACGTAAAALALAVLATGTASAAGQPVPPSAGAILSSSFSAVSVVPRSADAIAVGTIYGSSGRGRDLIEWWNGSKWTLMKSPAMPSSANGSLSGVWVVSKSDAWAGGYESTGSPLLHWNGRAWSFSPVSGTPAGTSISISAIEGSSASNIWAVGGIYGNSGQSTPVELHFDGTRWTAMEQGRSGLSLQSVAVVSPSLAWSVGGIYGNNGQSTPVVMKYNGTSWSALSTPAPKGAGLAAVSATGSIAWVVGCCSTNGPSTDAFAMVWTGSKWETQKVPTPSGHPSISTVLALPGGTAWVAGSVGSTKGESPFVDRFAKGKWTSSKLPATGHASGYISGVAATGATNVWEVGAYWTGRICQSPTAPLAYHYTTSWVLTKTVAPSGAATTAVPHC